MKNNITLKAYPQKEIAKIENLTAQAIYMQKEKYVPVRVMVSNRKNKETWEKEPVFITRYLTREKSNTIKWALFDVLSIVDRENELRITKKILNERKVRKQYLKEEKEFEEYLLEKLNEIEKKEREKNQKLNNKTLDN